MFKICFSKILQRKTIKATPPPCSLFVAISVACKPFFILSLVTSEPKPSEKPEERTWKRSIFIQWSQCFHTSMEKLKFSAPCVLLTYSLFRMTSLLLGFVFSVRCFACYTSLKADTSSAYPLPAVPKGIHLL